jgi:hypothetical protein
MLKGRRSIRSTTLSDILSPVFCDCPLKYYIKVPIEGDPGGGRTARCRVRRPGSVELISGVRGKADCPLEDFNPAGSSSTVEAKIGNCDELRRKWLPSRSGRVR